MKTNFTNFILPEPDPEPPQPTPFPVRIITDPVRRDSSSELGDREASPDDKKRSDYFYDAWDNFLAIEPKRAKSTATIVRKTVEEREAVECSPGDGLQFEENAAKSYEQAAEECRAKVAAIVQECQRLNQKYRDAVFDIETNTFCVRNLGGMFPKSMDKLGPPPWAKRVEDIFAEPQFFIDGASARDVHQGQGGDCWFLAALMAIAAKKELIENLCIARDEKAGVYGFVFFRGRVPQIKLHLGLEANIDDADGEWIHEVIDDKLFLKVGDDDDLCVVRDWDSRLKQSSEIRHDGEKLQRTLQRGGEALYFSHCKSDETWLPLIEKAYAKAHGDYFAIDGGDASEGIEDLTGGVGVVINPEDIMDKDRFWREQLSLVNEKYLFGGGSQFSYVKGVIAGHYYAVLRTWEEDGLRLLKLRNPWGEFEWNSDWSDGSKLWTPDMMRKLEHTFGDDGEFWISYQDFLAHFPAINRVRLFSKDWQVAQQWTSVNVPWTVDYMDSHFQFTISKKCPVVVVLSQPDERYYGMLGGRYSFSLHFRVYREGDEGRYIVRSMHRSGDSTMYTRSVSAEIEDLEPGTYDVMFKVTATRLMRPTADECIRNLASVRKEKLLHAGRRYDYAMTKGNLRGLEKANKTRAIEELQSVEKGGYKRVRRMNQEEKERARRRKKRIDDAMREKREGLEKKYRDEKKKYRDEKKKYRDEKRNYWDEKRKYRDEKKRTQQRRGKDHRSANDALEQSVARTEATPQSKEPSKMAADEPANAQDSSAPGQDVSRIEESTQSEHVAEKADGKPDVADDEGNEGARDTEGGADDAKSASEAARSEGHPEALAETLSNLDVQSQPEYLEAREGAVSPLEEEYESPPEQPEELTDNDFDWDSDMDGPFYWIEEDGSSPAANSARNEIFAQDPWNAMCVLGLRVYSLNADAKIRVIKAENDS